MKYKFSTKVFGQEGIYGIEYESLERNEKALFEINSYIWTSEEVQNMLDEINSITNEDFRYSVEGGALLILIDKDEAHLFNLHNRSQKEADIIWPTEKFIKFLKEFQEFLQKIGR
ncbi:hypothetical protein [Chryseobacterium sp. VD8]|uniref:hypothetical protein n=1 Tax=Chryseobacterium sp. VD8 TaxID=3081254 RepID=UPI00301A465A